MEKIFTLFLSSWLLNACSEESCLQYLISTEGVFFLPLHTMQSQPFMYNNIQPQPAPVPLQYQQLPPQQQAQQFSQANVIDSLNAVNQHIQQQQQQHQQQPQPEKKLGLSS